MEQYDTSREYARARDEAANSGVRERFSVPTGQYVDGNSLGPLSADAERTLGRVLEEWRDLGIAGWTDADPPWFSYGEYLGERLAPLVGADGEEVVVANSTTVNVHTLVGTFLDMADEAGLGQRVLVNELDFPTDHYAVRAQFRLRGLDPDEHLVVVESRDGRTIEETDVEATLKATPEVGVLFMPSVLYRSGQLLDVERLTHAAHANEAFAGFDLAHSVGVVPHNLAAADVDFATWCHYKYLNAGPGATAGLYLNRTHFGTTPALTGWWGHEKETQFEMNPTYTPADSAGAFQIGTVPMLAAAPLEGSLDVVEVAGNGDARTGVERLRERSVALTEYLLRLVDDRLPEVAVGTPRAPDRRGGHVALEHPESYRLGEALRARDVVVDVRPPNVVRVAPSPYYVGFEDIWLVVEKLREILDERAHERFDRPDGVT
jgi:kynureninase